MPKVSTNQKGGVIVFDEQDFINGYAPQGGKDGATQVVKIGPGFAFASNFDPFKDYGLARPGLLAQNPTNNNLVTAKIVSSAVKNSNIMYLLSADGKFFEFNYTGTFALTSDATFPHTIAHGAHTTFVGQDVIIYKHNVSSTPTFSAFYSFYDNTDWDIGRFDLTSTFDDDYMSTVPATPLASPYLTGGQGVPHPMCIGADDVLYIGSGRYVHGYDGSIGTDGKFMPALVTLPQGFVVTSLLKSSEYLLIGGVYTGPGGIAEIYNGQAYVYPWNYIDQDISAVYDCEDPYLCSMFMYKGSPAVLTKGPLVERGGLRLKVLSGDRYDSIAELPSFGTPINRGVEVVNNKAYINSGGKIYTVGNPFTGGNDVNQICSSSALTDSGFVKSIVYNGTISPLFSSGGADVSRFLAVPTNSYSLESITVEPQFTSFQQGRVTNVVVYYKRAISSARMFKLNLYTNAAELSTTVVDNITAVVSPPIKQYLVDSSGNPLPQFKSIAISMVAEGGAGTNTIDISRVEIYFENTNFDS